MRKFAMFFVIMLIYLGMTNLTYANPEKITFFGQGVGAYNEALKPEYILEAGLDYNWCDGRLGGFAFFVVEESTATAIGGGTVNLFPWLQVGVGGGYDQEPKDIVGAGMLLITNHCDWEVRTYGWIGQNKFYNYWVEGFVDTEHHVTFRATWARWKGAGPWIGLKIPETPVELRFGAKWVSPFYPLAKEGADPTYEATFRINLP